MAAQRKFKEAWSDLGELPEDEPPLPKQAT